MHKFVARGTLHHSTRVHHIGVIADIASAGDIVGDIEEAEAAFIGQPLHQVENTDANRYIEHRYRLVGQHHFWFHREGSSEGNALALATTQLIRELGCHFSGRAKPNGIEQFVNTISRRLLARNLFVDLQRPLEMVRDGMRRVQLSERILEHHLHIASITQ